MAKTPKLVLFLAVFLLVSPVFAATTDFTANGDITVTGVTFGDTAIDVTILDESTAESWSFDSGTFTVTNPGSAFKVACSDTNVKAISVTSGSATLACAKNSTPGTSYVTFPTTSGTYTLTLTTTNITYATTYNSACGAATCENGYSVIGSGSAAYCIMSTSGSGSAVPATPATPAVPATPATPAVPATPATPAVPATPATPAKAA
ncbi:MAG: hypothetical protein PHQ42_04130, partial [Patescibacteria group bacterium]|nr:hypothetical protein [Patescibacteria group bacterium]